MARILPLAIRSFTSSSIVIFSSPLRLMISGMDEVVRRKPGLTFAVLFEVLFPAACLQLVPEVVLKSRQGSEIWLGW